MKPILIALAASLSLTAGAALAKNDNPGKAKGHTKNQVQIQDSAGVIHTTNCPPGLAKKNPPCVPPGQAKKHYDQGEVIHNYVLIENPAIYGLQPNGHYVQAGGYVYQVDRNTQEVLALIGAVANILN